MEVLGNWTEQQTHFTPRDISPARPSIFKYFLYFRRWSKCFFLNKIVHHFQPANICSSYQWYVLVHMSVKVFFRILISLFLIMCRCIYLYMDMWHEFRGQRLWIPWSWNCRLFWDTWHAWREPNSGLPEEQRVDLLAKPSLQPQWWKVFTAACSYISQADWKHQYHLVPRAMQATKLYKIHLLPSTLNWWVEPCFLIPGWLLN